MKCDRVEEIIESYVDRGLPPDVTAEVDEHIGTCDSCRQKVEAAAKSLHMIRDVLGWVTPGEEFDGKITRRVIELPPPSRAAARDGAAPDRIAADAAGPGRKRLLILAVGAAVMFALALFVIIWCLPRKG